MRSVMSHDFSKVPRAEIQRSAFDRSCGYKTTLDSGYLVPIFIEEALPGDTHNVSMSSFARMATPVFPIMDNIFADVFFFAVPLRLIWDNFERFMGAQDNPSDTTDYLTPKIVDDTGAPTGGYTAAEGSLGDYFGIATQVALLSEDGQDSGIVSFYHRAYNLIYNEWFRDQNLQDSVVVDKGDGPDDSNDYNLLRRGKRHDYFTSGLPWPQKGPGIGINLVGDAPVQGIGWTTNTYSAGPVSVYEAFGNDASYADQTNFTNARVEEDPNNPGYPYVRANLADASAITINAFREAFQLQRLLERDARGGTRYTEIVRSHFGVVSDDARLQRPEFLGGGSTRVNISPVAQTSESGSSPQGNLAAFGTFSHNGTGFVKSFTEHCVVIGLINIRADLNYQQGVNRMFTRSTRYDYYWPALAHLGEQAIKGMEIYADGTSADHDPFAYQERFAEYRYKPSLVTGKFRSNATGTLDPWHLAQDFSSRPALNASFIEDNPPIDRVVAVPSEPQFLLDTYFKIRSARPMPMYSVPGLIDHF